MRAVPSCCSRDCKGAGADDNGATVSPTQNYVSQIYSDAIMRNSVIAP